jgi:hypothetical protein
MSALRALFPEAAARPAQTYRRLRTEYAGTLARFFGPLFDEMRAPEAAECDAFVAACAAMRASFSRFGTGLMLARDFDGFFRPMPPGKEGPSRKRRFSPPPGDETRASGPAKQIGHPI